VPIPADIPVSEQLADWPRKLYQAPAGRPFLFYVVFGVVSEALELSPPKYRSAGVFPGLDLSRYTRLKYPDVLAGFCEGYLWNELKRRQAALAQSIASSPECLILRGELDDQPNLNYLRDTVGLPTCLLDHGGIVVYDPLMFHWWEPETWRERVFRPNAPVPRHHVVVLTSEEPDPALTWFHTRGMRKFGRPDLSAHGVPSNYRDAFIDLFERFIELQGSGGSVPEGQEIRMRTLPEGLTCRHAGHLDDPDFNNVHIEITPP
jgi:hypothetical protein